MYTLDFGEGVDKLVLGTEAVSSHLVMASTSTYLLRLFTLVPSRKSVVTSSVIR